MTVHRKINSYYLFILPGLLLTGLLSLAQSKRLDAEKWATELSKRAYTRDKVYMQLDSLLEYAEISHGIVFGGSSSLYIDSASVFNFLNALATEGKSTDDHFKVAFNCLRARAIYYTNRRYTLAPFKEEVKQLLSSAMDIAYRSEDEYLIAFTSLQYAQIIYQFGEQGLTVMYGRNAIDLAEKLSYPVRARDYQFMAEMFYQVREYNDCIKYGKKAVTAWKNSPNEFKTFTASCMNTIALGYHRQKMYDSAFIFYNQALQLATTIKDTVWMGIVSGNMAQVLYMQGKYDTAYVLLKNDYSSSKRSGYYDNAANSLQWAARADLARGNKTTALSEVREAFQLLKLWPDANYLKNAYYTTTQIFREMGDYDSAFYYNNLWSTINDSLEKVVATSSLAISKARLNDETSRYNIQTLNREERSQLMWRNIIIVGIVLLSVIGLLYLNRSRIKLHYKREMADAELLAAKEKLQLFTENIIEKTSLIEKLETQVRDKVRTSEHQEIIATLSSQTILTEADWEKFKTLYETIYPGFFSKLKTTIPDITIAEQRMAALIRLHLTTRQLASLLGISPNSVNKTRQRLRQRFNLAADINVEEFIIKL
jgi:hypothetical protein